MKMTTTTRFESDADGIATLTIEIENRPMNVITPEFMAELDAAIARLKADAAVKGLVITSARSAFMAGADLKDLVTAYDRGVSAVEAYQWSQDLSNLYRRLETCGKPVAAAIQGVALGGGFELVLACHHRVLESSPKAGVGLPEVKVGLLPGAGGTQRLPRMIGITKALPLIVEGTQLKPEKALELGLVDEIAPAAELVTRAKQWILASGVAEQPWDRKGFRLPGGTGSTSPGTVQTFLAGIALTERATQRNYPAPLAILSAVYEGTHLPIDRGLAVESKYFAQLLTGAVARNLMRTMFVNKGLADKLARRPEGIAKSQVAKLGILGAGMMGSGIAYVSALSGLEVVLLDTSIEAAEKGKAYSRKLLEKNLARGRSTPQAADALLGRIRPTASYDDLAGCDFVIEAVFERRDIKADVTRRAEAVMPADAIFASNTSTLPITGLAAASARPQNFIGVHFFSPVEKMPLVEIIVGRRTSKAAIARALDYVGQLRKTPIVVNDSRGFYTSRVFGTYCHEGMAMLAEGVNPALIENVAKAAGMPVGPLAVSDEVSIELQWKVIAQTEADLGAKYERPVSYDVVRKFAVDLGRLGRKSGHGFYEYPADGPKFLWSGLGEIYPPPAQQPDPEEVRMRLLCIQSLETVRCLEDSVVTHPADADLGSILGWGFPAWTGGTLSFIETLGVERFVSVCNRLAKKHGERFKPTRRLRTMARKGERFYPLEEQRLAVGS
jgi:3-hydroxyacyl-CoA dehydrogenase / enoyl-CoA hydratase / 3-hydroxybutyryl-CoA epimerase